MNINLMNILMIMNMKDLQIEIYEKNKIKYNKK